MNKGLLVEVLRSKLESTNGGVSSFNDTIFLIGEGVPEVFEENNKYPVLKLVRRGTYLHAEPNWKPTPGHIGWMMGGNFIYSSDSRFPNDYPIAVHDRQESQLDNDALSR